MHHERQVMKGRFGPAVPERFFFAENMMCIIYFPAVSQERITQ
jgi:hypothetical protein